jgi:hypothetical protein
LEHRVRKPLGLPLHHQATVHAVAFSPDGQAVTLSSNKTARLWTTTTFKPIETPLQFEPLGNADARGRPTRLAKTRRPRFGPA